MIEFYNRTAYWLFVLEIPHVRGKELVSAVKFKLSSLYPGNINECNIQIRKNGAKKWSYLIFIFDKDTGNTMLPLSPLFVQHIYARKTANILYVGRKWLDYVRIEDGAIKSSTVKIRNEDMLLDDVKKLCSTETNLEIYSDKTDRIILTPLQEDNNIRFLDNHTELKKIDVHKISLFAEKSPVIKRQRVLAVASIMFLIIAGSWLLYQHSKDESEHSAQSRLEQEQLQKAALEKQHENQLLSELKVQYQKILDSKTATPFDIAAVIAECADQRTRIQSATFNGNFFQIEGTTNNSLNLLRQFENHRLVSNARLHQVHPAASRDTFTLSGTVKTETASIDEILPANEQITALESLIAAETNFSPSEAQLSPSAFGEAVTALFSKWGCAVNSYQFMNEPNRTEVEYSLRGSGNAFFNALHEIKTTHRLWDVHLTQIRNLYPRNMLDIVVRIKTEYSPTQSGNSNVTPPETVNPYPVANISRNYFVPAPIPRIPIEPVVKEPAPIVAVPPRTERASWLEYVGSVNDNNGGTFIYVKNTRTGAILKLENLTKGNMRYADSSSGSILAYIDDHIYEINRR